MGLYPGDTVVLAHGEETAVAPAQQGGTGKTQIAVAFSHALWGARAVDALVWVPATSREAIVAGFAQAARTVGAADRAVPAEAAAGHFTGWLANTRRPWALILDDLTSLADLDGLWPAGQAGQVVITTGLPEAAFPAGPRIAPVGGFSRREVLAYLSARLTAFPGQRAEALDLGEDLDGLPLALAQAAAVMSLNRLSCREYRAGSRSDVSTWPWSGWTAFPRRAGHLVAGGGVRARATALGRRLAGSRAGRHARPARHSRCGADQPGRVRLRGRAAEHRGSGGPGPGPRGHDQPGPGRPGQHRPGQRGPDGAGAPERAGRGARHLPAADYEQAVLAAAEALLQAWPEADRSQDPGERAHLEQAHVERAHLEQAPLRQALRDCTAALWAADSPAPHPATGQHAARSRAELISVRRPSRASCGRRKPTRCCSGTG